MFFTYRSRVCADVIRSAAARDVELDNTSLGGGVGANGGY
jgi:hypothetical protein